MLEKKMHKFVMTKKAWKNANCKLGNNLKKCWGKGERMLAICVLPAGAGPSWSPGISGYIKVCFTQRGQK